MDGKTRILFVCRGNTCRSPLAEAIFIKLLSDMGQSSHWIIDSAAIEDWHVGKAPNPRAIRMMGKYDLLPYSGVSRQITRTDFVEFDYIIGMDYWNIEDLKALARDTEGSRASIVMMRDFDPEGRGDIPDPYCDRDMLGFEQCYEICVRSLKQFLSKANAHPQ